MAKNQVACATWLRTAYQGPAYRHYSMHDQDSGTQTRQFLDITTSYRSQRLASTHRIKRTYLTVKKNCRKLSKLAIDAFNPHLTT